MCHDSKNIFHLFLGYSQLHKNCLPGQGTISINLVNAPPNFIHCYSVKQEILKINLNFCGNILRVHIIWTPSQMQIRHQHLWFDPKAKGNKTECFKQGEQGATMNGGLGGVFDLVWQSEKAKRLHFSNEGMQQQVPGAAENDDCVINDRLVQMVIPSAKSSVVFESLSVSSSESECSDEQSDVKEKCPDDSKASVLREYLQSSSGWVLMAEDQGERTERIAGELEGSGKIMILAISHLMGLDEGTVVLVVGNQQNMPGCFLKTNSVNIYPLFDHADQDIPDGLQETSLFVAV
ncbi:hypothetical protein F4604DRAFT_1676761 [Suillus subluteus]|nr:hypothetical protein F4604DRAFT_1676761 [Suillus subluteus]